MPDDYLTGQVLWGVWETKEILRQLAVYFVKSHLGMGIAYSWLMGIAAFFAALQVLRVILMKTKDWKYKFLYAASMAVVWLSAHMLTIYAGTVTVIRSQLAYPFVMAFLLLFVLEQTGGRRTKPDDSLKRRGVCLALSFLAAAGIWGQLGDAFRLWYTEDMKDKMDMAVVQKVINQVDQLGLGAEPPLPMVFVGDYSPRINRACIDTNADLSIGVSCWERVNEQPNRLVRMIENHFGVSYQRADWEKVYRAREISRDMPSYPKEGYVQVREDLIVIKMSDQYE